MEVSACAPGRVELLGNHTDYNEGVVLGAAINRRLCISGQATVDGIISLASSLTGAVTIRSNEVSPQSADRWANYSLGVVSELRNAGIPVTGFSAQISGDLPAGSGLSSSAALEVATALFLLKICQRDLPRLEIAKICQRAEHRFAGVQSGLLDQVTCLFGKRDQAVFLDCRTEEIRTIPLPPELALIISDSGKRRQLADGKYNQRREETRAAAAQLGARALRDVSPRQLLAATGLSPVLRLRAAHIVEENGRVRKALELLARGDAVEFGRLMTASHRSSQQNFENSTAELDALVEIALALPGVLGARLTGGGFGGATVTLCRKSQAAAAAEEIRSRYRALTSIDPQVFICEVADGAH